MGQLRQPTSLDLPSGLVGGKMGTALALYELGNKLHSQAQNFKGRHFAYTVSVSEEDPLYTDIHSWLLSIMPDEKHRSLEVSSPHRRSRAMETTPESDPDESSVKRPPLTVSFDDSSMRKVVIGGHKVSVWLHSPETSSSDKSGWGREPKKIKLQSNTYAGQQAIIAELNRLNDEKATARKATLKMVSSWGSWQTRSDLPPRTMESVFMPEEQKRRILNDVEDFLAQEDRYNKMAFPWHRGYMFHGPPGTGKTSLVKAIANHFNLDLWYIGLADLTAEASLLGLLSQVGPRSILLLEDIDTIRIAREDTESDSGKITTGSLLNALDGIATPHGLITMMTTNHFNTLDPRLVRAGRMDVVEELGWPTMQTLEQMFAHFYGISPAPWWGTSSTHQLEGISVAQIAEIFKSNMHDPEAAAQEAFKITIDAPHI
jgi:hypothetical protein